MKPPSSFTKEEVDYLTNRIQNGGTEVVEVEEKTFLLLFVTISIYITSKRERDKHTHRERERERERERDYIIVFRGQI
mgnify:CR=1 FL=1